MSANIEIEIGTGNVYADLGFADAEEMVIKAGLAMKIAEIIKRKSYSQTEAANLVGLPQPKLSGLLRGQFRGISEAKMIEVLNPPGARRADCRQPGQPAKLRQGKDDGCFCVTGVPCARTHAALAPLGGLGGASGANR